MRAVVLPGTETIGGRRQARGGGRLEQFGIEIKPGARRQCAAHDRMTTMTSGSNAGGEALSSIK